MLTRRLVNTLLNRLRNIKLAMTSVKGPQLQVNDLVLVKIVAHKARHKNQDKWESEEYIVIEQPISGTPVYRVRPVTGTKVRT